ncbi:unnamed protein product [Penicillium manginii]
MSLKPDHHRGLGPMRLWGGDDHVTDRPWPRATLWARRRRGADGPFLLTRAADQALRRLAEWAREQATFSRDYTVDQSGARTYRLESLQPWVEPLLLQMNLAGRPYHMHREPESYLINVRFDPSINEHVLLIPVNVVNETPPAIQDWVQANLPLQVGYCYTLFRTVMIQPVADFLVVEKRPRSG